ncbi:hypothetical protein PENTCL1PPCAC_8541 [Pristionchus entomophagus]|uniref:Protein kinase domain-containing protein n=1 Tax=Pristionchus entomophagus TaxID=358040 RepID=A0AAV5SSK8_9BILA|nr:hypothetical protein PENTCL1PPCAC_8541 [Pristionchus entomophagus]
MKRISLRECDKITDAVLKEIRAMAQLDHSGIVRCYMTWIEKPPEGWQNHCDQKILKDLKLENQQNYDGCSFIYIQMQLCAHSLERWLEQNQTADSRTLSVMKSWFKQLVSAVSYIHEKGMIHSDLRPSNILFVKYRPKISDLGTVTEYGVGNSVNAKMSTRRKIYKSPEQLSSKSKHNSKSDIFALGLILAELCVVIPTEDAEELFDNVRMEKPISLFDHIPEVKRIVSWLTKVEGADRPTCEEILDDSDKEYYDELEKQPVSEDTYVSKFLRDFKTISLLGVGNFGCIFEVEYTQIRFKSAVKRIPLQERDTSNYLKKVDGLKSFDHPGIVRYYNSWTEEHPSGWQRYTDETLFKEHSSYINFMSHYKDNSNFFYIQMELCQISLAEWLTKTSSRDLITMKYWFRQIVSAVEYIHSMGIIHRNLKPRKILFAGEDRLKVLCDVGGFADNKRLFDSESKEIAEERTMGYGTPLYMAPEQMSWMKYSSKVDVFALGLILTELCVVLPKDQLVEVFNNYRSGKLDTVLDQLPELKQFVTWLTNVQGTERPTCKEILVHPFLRTDETFDSSQCALKSAAEEQTDSAEEQKQKMQNSMNETMSNANFKTGATGQLLNQDSHGYYSSIPTQFDECSIGSVGSTDSHELLMEGTSKQPQQRVYKRKPEEKTLSHSYKKHRAMNNAAVKLARQKKAHEEAFKTQRIASLHHGSYSSLSTKLERSIGSVGSTISTTLPAFDDLSGEPLNQHLNNDLLSRDVLHQIERSHSVSIEDDWAPPFHIPIAYSKYRQDIGRKFSCSLGFFKKFDSPDGSRSVVIKIFTSPFQSKDRAQAILRELNLLRTIRHENIILLLECYTVDESLFSMESIYHITEYCGEPLRIHIGQGGYSIELAKKWTRELLRAVQYLHSIDIIHRNLHPDNICIDSANKLIVTGFGNAHINSGQYLTYGTCTRPYSPIELLVPWRGGYDVKVDIWSVSAILCELITGRPLFSSEDDANESVKIQMEYCGSIDNAIKNKILSDRISYMDRQKLYKYIYSSNCQRKDFISILLSTILPGRGIIEDDIIENEGALRDFIDNTLQFDPVIRMSASQAVIHRFLQNPHPREPHLPEDNETAIIALRNCIWNQIKTLPKTLTFRPSRDPVIANA